MSIGPTFIVAMTMAVLSITALAAAAAVTVSQKGRAFSVAAVQVIRGQTVHFNNEDQFNHQIYVDSPSFNFESDEQEPGTSVDIQFSRNGLFQVRCHIHPKMLLTVDVH